MTTVESPKTTSSMSEPVTRGPHAERTAAMRKRVISAAIECLGRLGYTSTTLQAVTDAAGVSRGAMLHHFPTKCDLMIAVAEYAADKQNREVRRELADTKPGMDRYLSITRATWTAMQQPAAIALLEIMMGSRSDADLAARFPSVIEAFETNQRDSVWEQAQSVGITDRQKVDVMTVLHTAAMRGLVLDLILSGKAPRAEECMQLLEQYKGDLTGELVVQAAK